MRNYFIHLVANWKVALHALNDFAEHFLHGLLPFIHWEHCENEKISNRDR